MYSEGHETRLLWHSSKNQIYYEDLIYCIIDEFLQTRSRENNVLTKRFGSGLADYAAVRRPLKFYGKRRHSSKVLKHLEKCSQSKFLYRSGRIEMKII